MISMIKASACHTYPGMPLEKLTKPSDCVSHVVATQLQVTLKLTLKIKFLTVGHLGHISTALQLGTQKLLYWTEQKQNTSITMESSTGQYCWVQNNGRVVQMGHSLIFRVCISICIYNCTGALGRPSAPQCLVKMLWSQKERAVKGSEASGTQRTCARGTPTTVTTQQLFHTDPVFLMPSPHSSVTLFNNNDLANKLCNESFISSISQVFI